MKQEDSKKRPRLDKDLPCLSIRPLSGIYFNPKASELIGVNRVELRRINRKKYLVLGSTGYSATNTSNKKARIVANPRLASEYHLAGFQGLYVIEEKGEVIKGEQCHKIAAKKR